MDYVQGGDWRHDVRTWAPCRGGDGLSSRALMWPSARRAGRIDVDGDGRWLRL